MESRSQAGSKKRGYLGRRRRGTRDFAGRTEQRGAVDDWWGVRAAIMLGIEVLTGKARASRGLCLREHEAVRGRKRNPRTPDSTAILDAAGSCIFGFVMLFARCA